MRLTVVSIGALAANDLWDERTPARTGHATTTLIETRSAGDDRAPVRLLVDPGLPAPALVARLAERTGLRPDDITHVFLTSFHPEARRGLEAFDRADWLIAHAEREAVGVRLIQSLQRLTEHFDTPAEDLGDGVERVLRSDIAAMQRCRPAPDRLAEGVDLFPLPGCSPGSCGLLVGGAHTTLIAGDAVPTAEHLRRGRVLPSCEDANRAKESFEEAVEIADVLVPGRDNITINPVKRPF